MFRFNQIHLFVKSKWSSPHLDNFPNLAVCDGHLHTREVRVEPPLQGGHELNASGVACVDGLDCLRYVGGDGLLAEHVLPVGGASFDLRGLPCDVQQRPPMARATTRST